MIALLKTIIISCLLAGLPLGSLALFENVFSMRHYTIDKDLWLSAITGQLVVYIAMFAYNSLYHHVKEKRKEERSKHTTHHNVYDMDYHRICKSQAHLCKDYEAIKQANNELREENRKLRKEKEDKDHALDEMTKKVSDLKKELHKKDERLKHGKQVVRANNEKRLKEEAILNQTILSSEEEIQELQHKLHEANKESLSMNHQLINNKGELQQLSDSLTERDRMLVFLQDDLSTKNSELSQLQQELTASKEEVASLAETLSNKGHQIWQHEEALKIVIAYVISGLDDLCTIHNDSLEESVDETLNPEICHFPTTPSLPEPAGVCLPTPEKENDTSDLSDDEEDSPPDHFNSHLRYVKLIRGPKGLGFSVAGGKGSPNGDLPICIRSVIPECTAARDGRIRQGDVILSVNGISFENISHKVAVETLTRFRGDITLKLCSP